MTSCGRLRALRAARPRGREVRHRRRCSRSSSTSARSTCCVARRPRLDKALTAKIISTVAGDDVRLLRQPVLDLRAPRPHRLRPRVRAVLRFNPRAGIALLCLAFTHYVLGFDSRPRRQPLGERHRPRSSARCSGSGPTGACVPRAPGRRRCAPRKPPQPSVV